MEMETTEAKASAASPHLTLPRRLPRGGPHTNARGPTSPSYLPLIGRTTSPLANHSTPREPHDQDRTAGKPFKPPVRVRSNARPRVRAPDVTRAVAPPRAPHVMTRRAFLPIRRPRGLQGNGVRGAGATPSPRGSADRDGVRRGGTVAVGSRRRYITRGASGFVYFSHSQILIISHTEREKGLGHTREPGEREREREEEEKRSERERQREPGGAGSSVASRCLCRSGEVRALFLVGFPCLLCAAGLVAELPCLFWVFFARLF
jgi:hypothetical protein